MIENNSGVFVLISIALGFIVGLIMGIILLIKKIFANPVPSLPIEEASFMVTEVLPCLNQYIS